ncbi:hypothetical protein AB6E94_19635 [Vibrio lentus]|uniref:CRISPR-associated protein Cas4 n=2 Tax=Vibrionaceae TaxID=641 RepID=UPI000C81C7B6|nr:MULTISPECIES: hypothetical protein [Vibrio]MCC4837979.1 hypothetical protein [Vibrio lentus]PMG17916.1 hypothetical protein BCU98_00860 [Vibrio splendidus]
MVFLIDASMAIITVSICVVCLVWLFRFALYSKTPFGFRGKLYYIDDQNNRGYAFFNRSLRIGATPDMVYETSPNKLHVVEKKSRQYGIFESDFVQAEMGAIALSENSSKRVSHVTVSNANQTVTRRVPNAKRLLKKRKDVISMARRIANGEVIEVRKPEPRKCKACRYYDECKDIVRGL